MSICVCVCRCVSVCGYVYTILIIWILHMRENYQYLFPSLLIPLRMMFNSTNSPDKSLNFILPCGWLYCNNLYIDHVISSFANGHLDWLYKQERSQNGIHNLPIISQSSRYVGQPGRSSKTEMSVVLKGVAPARSTTLQSLAPWPCVCGQHLLDSVATKIKSRKYEFGRGDR